MFNQTSSSLFLILCIAKPPAHDDMLTYIQVV